MVGGAMTKTWTSYSDSSDGMPFWGDATPSRSDSTRSSSPQRAPFGCRADAEDDLGVHERAPRRAHTSHTSGVEDSLGVHERAPRRAHTSGVTLLGRDLMGEYLAANSAVKVKNTFIDGFKEDEDDEGPPMIHIRTCPAPMKVEMSSMTLAEECNWGFTGLPDGARRGPVQEAKVVQGSTLSGDDLEADRQPEWSLGSARHDGKGSCRPCAWFWKPQGCANGADCGHCHMCPEGELKARKKIKVKAMRAAGL